MRITAILAACTLALVASRWWPDQAAPVANLVYQNIGVTDNTFPTAIGVKFENIGAGKPDVKGVVGYCDYSYVIAGPGDPTLIPEEFRWQVEIGPVDEAGIIHLMLQWTADDVPIDLLAVVRMSFVIEYGDAEKLTTDPMTFLVANNPKVQEAIASGAFNFDSDYSELVDQIESLKGYKTRSVERLLSRLRHSDEQI